MSESRVAEKAAADEHIRRPRALYIDTVFKTYTPPITRDDRERTLARVAF